jgi:hypothetical protein
MAGMGNEFFDAWVRMPVEPLEPAAAPSGLAGALIAGPEAARRRTELERRFPDRLWRHVEPLARIVGVNHAGFPSHSATVVDLQLTGEDLFERLNQPAAWWPLCEPLRGGARLLRLDLGAGAALVAAAKRLVNHHPEVTFWIDPFARGPVSGWQGQVRLAEHTNVLLSTRGLFPCEMKGRAALWPEEAAEFAVRFLVGEVGAGALLYASELSWDDLRAGRDALFRGWLDSVPSLDPVERDLVLLGNARRVFSKSSGAPAPV